MRDIERARQYSRTKERISLFSTVTGLLFAILFLLSGAAKLLATLILPRRGSSAGSRAIFTTTLALGSWLASLPLAYLSGFVIEHRFGLSRQHRGAWFSDQIKGQAFALLLAIPLTEGLYWVIGRFKHWWLIVTLLTIPITTVIAQLFPVLIAPRFNKFTPLEDDELKERIRHLASRTGIEVADVMKMDMSRRTSKANAFFTGIGPTRRIVLSDTLIEQFTHAEIEIVVAHEIAHQTYRDIWRFIALGTLFTLATSFATDRALRGVLQRHGNLLVGTQNIADVRSLPVLGIAFSLASLLLNPIQLAYSREVERRADAFALALIRHPDVFKRTMMKLAQVNLADPMPSRLRVLLLYSHPSITERIARAEANKPIGHQHDPEDENSQV